VGYTNKIKSPYYFIHQTLAAYNISMTSFKTTLTTDFPSYEREP